MNTPVWYKDKTFWQQWAAHAVVACLLGWVFMGDIVRLMFTNAGRKVTEPSVALFVFLTLVGIWGTQMLAMWIRPHMNTRNRWLMILGSYVQAIGPSIAIALTIMDAWRGSNKAARYIGIMGLSIVLWWVLHQANTLYAMIISGPFVKYLVH